MTSKNFILSKLQNKSLFLNNNTIQENNNTNHGKDINKTEPNNAQEQDINIKTYLEDMKKTLELNLDIINKFYKKDKNVNELINSINSRIKEKKEEIEGIQKKTKKSKTKNEDENENKENQENKENKEEKKENTENKEEKKEGVEDKEKKEGVEDKEKKEGVEDNDEHPENILLIFFILLVFHFEISGKDDNDSQLLNI